eukprot:GHVH01005009.1.p1 GENE.GHVH01005009.1~~GHVH01005009.1.p1  ORF type:complete len:257 (+),score=78.25 GHVH01005009.1:48-818(+)
MPRKTSGAPDLKLLEEKLEVSSYVSGYNATVEDFDMMSRINYSMISKTKDYPSILRWFKHMQSYSEEEKKAFPLHAKKKSTKKGPKAANAKEEDKEEDKEDSDDEFDLFGEETADEAAAKVSMAEKMEKTKIDYSKAKAAKVVINKNSLVFDIIPGDSETSFDELFAKVTSIAMDGLVWGETKKVVPMCFGLQKMQLVATVLDSLDTETLVENILVIDCDEKKAENRLAMRDAGEDEDDDEEYYVNNVEIISFQKL